MNRLLFFPFLSRHKFAFIVLLLALLTATGVSGRGWFRSFDKDPAVTVPTPETLKALQSDTRGDRVEAEVITILPNGFQPSQITRPRGQFLLVIDNRSGSDDLTPVLVSVRGEKLREVKHRGAEKISRQFEDLPPGEYLLTEADHPDWICRITITPN